MLQRRAFASRANPQKPEDFNKPRTPKKTKGQWRKELVAFYEKYGIDFSDASVDKAMDKWKGKEERMMAAVRKKYSAEIAAADEEKTEL